PQGGRVDGLGRHAWHEGARRRSGRGYRTLFAPVLSRPAIASGVHLAVDASKPTLHRVHRSRGVAFRPRGRGRNAGMSDGPPLVIGVAGGTGSGKSTIAEAMVSATRPGLVRVLPQDVYYKRSDDPVFRSRAVVNYDEPSAFDTRLLVAHIDELIAGRAIARPIYDFAASDRSLETVTVEPAPVLI